jgi:2-oxoisovalerate dehydrogenase E1 component beta subunit
VVDLVSLKPLDTEAILGHATSTGKVIIAHAANRMAGVGAEVAALIAEEAFESLDGPIVRLGGADTPVPFSPPLEDAYRPNADTIADAIRTLAAY